MEKILYSKNGIERVGKYSRQSLTQEVKNQIDNIKRVVGTEEVVEFSLDENEIDTGVYKRRQDRSYAKWSGRQASVHKITKLQRVMYGNNSDYIETVMPTHRLIIRSGYITLGRTANNLSPILTNVYDDKNLCLGHNLDDHFTSLVGSFRGGVEKDIENAMSLILQAQPNYDLSFHTSLAPANVVLVVGGVLNNEGTPEGVREILKNNLPRAIKVAKDYFGVISSVTKLSNSFSDEDDISDRMLENMEDFINDDEHSRNYDISEFRTHEDVRRQGIHYDFSLMFMGALLDGITDTRVIDLVWENSCGEWALRWRNAILATNYREAMKELVEGLGKLA